MKQKGILWFLLLYGSHICSLLPFGFQVKSLQFDEKRVAFSAQGK